MPVAVQLDRHPSELPRFRPGPSLDCAPMLDRSVNFSGRALKNRFNRSIYRIDATERGR
jgi:hypothetical protein